jgi:hypothetical protein
VPAHEGLEGRLATAGVPEDEFALASAVRASYHFGTIINPLGRSTMRRLLVPCLFAVLIFLPWSATPARTPPPQGWEERDWLRSQRYGLQMRLSIIRPCLEEYRNELALHEARRGGATWRPLPGPHLLPQIDPLVRRRQMVTVTEATVAEIEQELARIEKKLGLGP